MITGIILAAGSSTRMGQTKQLLPWKGKPLLQHVIDGAAAEAGLAEVIVVLGHAASEIRAAVTVPSGVRVVENPEFLSGQASSLRAGLTAADPRSHAALILLGDQPGVGPRDLREVLEGFAKGGRPVARAMYGDLPAHPVVLARESWAEILQAEGDVGAGVVLARHPQWVTLVSFSGLPPVEVDTPEDYRALLEG